MKKVFLSDIDGTLIKTNHPVLSSRFNMFPKISNFYRLIIWGAVLILVVIDNHVSGNLRTKQLERTAMRASVGGKG